MNDNEIVMTGSLTPEMLDYLAGLMANRFIKNMKENNNHGKDHQPNDVSIR